MKCPQCQVEATKVGAFWICPKHGQLPELNTLDAQTERSGLPIHPSSFGLHPSRVFLSYGHDANEELVRHIKTDLEKRGHNVWCDKGEVKGGHDWRRSITDSDVDQERVQCLLSKQPTRDPGICLDAITVAIGVKGACIQTILVESDPDILRPVNIGHVSWLDMHVWTKRRLAGEAIWGRWYQAKLAEIIRVVESEESRRLADQIETLDGHLSLDRAEDSPEGLDGIFSRFFQRQFPDLDRFRKDIRPALCVILAAFDPLPIESLQRFFNWQDEELRGFTHILASIFPVTTEAGIEVIKPFRKSLADWLVDETKAGPYFVSVEEGLQMLADFGWRDYARGVQSLCGYLLRYLPLLLFRAGRSHDANILLNDEEFHALRAHTRVLSYIQVEESRQRFPTVAELLDLRENEYECAANCSASECCSLNVSACDLDDKEASGLVARQYNYDGDIYRHWEYVTYDAVLSDGQIREDCVPDEHSLAEVLPRFQTPPVLIIKTSHLSGPSGPGDQYAYSEDITLFRVPSSLRLLHSKDGSTQAMVDALMSGCRPHWSADIQGYHANASSKENPLGTEIDHEPSVEDRPRLQLPHLSAFVGVTADKPRYAPFECGMGNADCGIRATGTEIRYEPRAKDRPRLYQ